MVADVHSFSEDVPSFAYWDTSFFINVLEDPSTSLIPTNFDVNILSDCKNYWKRLRGNKHRGGVFDFVLNEAVYKYLFWGIYEAAKQQSLFSGGIRGFNLARAMKDHPHLVDTKGNNILTDIQGFIYANKIAVIDYEKITEPLFTDAASFILSYKTCVTDSYILAFINRVATDEEKIVISVDSDFVGVDGFTVYIPDRLKTRLDSAT
jgi:hypothetical protein